MFLYIKTEPKLQGVTLATARQECSRTLLPSLPPCLPARLPRFLAGWVTGMWLSFNIHGVGLESCNVAMLVVVVVVDGEGGGKGRYRMEESNDSWCSELV
ncbi:hypothetical protein E2C01_092689 [Portunus trituberculatus]|uniref:Uncharacterized protein n=1 Tax=Portunus trituberculatus TaxID=210409 RepID=A0A5B7JSV0_PORTR|nr:hypothetical protein [Portunus trituberculatus]